MRWLPTSLTSGPWPGSGLDCGRAGGRKAGAPELRAKPPPPDWYLDRVRICAECEHHAPLSEQAGVAPTCDLILRGKTRDGLAIPAWGRRPAPCRYNEVLLGRAGGCPLGRF